MIYNPPSGGVTGTGADGEVTFWTGTSTISGDPIMRWDNTNKIFSVGNNLTGPTPTMLISYGAGSNGDYFATGNSFGCQVVPYRIVGAVKYFGVPSAQISQDDNNSGLGMFVTFNWAAVPGADGYRIFFQDTYYLGANYDYYYDTALLAVNLGHTGSIPFPGGVENSTTPGTTVTPVLAETIINSAGQTIVGASVGDGSLAVFQSYGNNYGTTVYGGSSFYLGAGAGLIADPNAVIQYTSDSNAANVWYNIGAGASNATFGFVSGGNFKSGITYSNNSGLWMTDNGAAGSPSTGMFIADGSGDATENGNFTVTGNASLNNDVTIGNGLTVVAGDIFLTNGDIHLDHALIDATSSPGASGNVLTSSGSSTVWKSPVAAGIPGVVATVDLATQSAAIAATTVYTPTSTGMHRISIYLQVTRAASTSSILGGSTGVVITYNDGDGNVAQTDTVALATTAGAIAITSAGNTTTTNLAGTLPIWAKTGVAIKYAIGYTSVGVTSMQYAAHLKVEAL